MLDDNVLSLFSFRRRAHWPLNALPIPRAVLFSSKEQFLGNRFLGETRTGGFPLLWEDSAGDRQSW